MPRSKSKRDSHPLAEVESLSQTIALAEADPHMRALLASALRAEGYGIIEMSNGEELLKHLATDLALGESRRTIGAVVLGAQVGGFTGLQVLSALRTVRCATPAILVTELGDVDTYRAARDLGAIAFEKPFDVDLVRDALRASVWGASTVPHGSEPSTSLP